MSTDNQGRAIVSSVELAKFRGLYHSFVSGCISSMVWQKQLGTNDCWPSGWLLERGIDQARIYFLSPRAVDLVSRRLDDHLKTHERVINYLNQVKLPGPSPRQNKQIRKTKEPTKRTKEPTMKELIPIQQSEISGQQIQTVNARDLHEFLENKDHFATWIKDRIGQFDFTEGQDFVTYSENPEKGRPSVEYALSLDMAKELSMVERNAKGKQARQYFIECERVALNQKPASPPIPLGLPDFNNPVAAARAWADVKDSEQKALAENKAALRQIEQDRPKVEFAEHLTDVKDGIDVGDFAKIVYDRFRLGRNSLFKLLRDSKVFLYDNMPYQRYLDLGWFLIKEGTYLNRKHNTRVPYTKTLITGKGQLGIFKMLAEKKGVTDAA
jgi:anti-repressor protein